MPGVCVWLDYGFTLEISSPSLVTLSNILEGEWFVGGVLASGQLLHPGLQGLVELTWQL